jgi:hypothetical protein
MDKPKKEEAFHLDGERLMAQNAQQWRIVGSQ